MAWMHHDLVTIIIRLLTAAILSGLIGWEREVKRHPAGFRTHMLVGVGACLMMILSLFGFNDVIQSNARIQYDPSRLPSYVISGIGFLGAGTIMVHGITVKGLTTAASIWVVSGIGLVVGAGMYLVALFTTLIVILSLIFLNKWEHFMLKPSKKGSLYLLVENKGVPLSAILGLLEKHQIRVEKIDVENVAEDENHLVKYCFDVAMQNGDALPFACDELVELQAVRKVYTKE